MNTFDLRSFFNFLKKNKGYTIINLFGFSISLMFVILLSIYIRQETSVDTFHEKKDRIFRLSNEKGCAFAFPIMNDLLAKYPEIESATRIWGTGSVVQKGEGEPATNAFSLLVDSSFFNIFSFPIIAGKNIDPLPTIQDVVLTESHAIKLFGSASAAVGKSLSINSQPYIVQGVTKDFKNTHFRNPDIIMRIENENERYFTSLSTNNGQLYLLIKPNADFNSRIPDVLEYFKSYFWIYKNNISHELFLTPIEECYYDTSSRTFLYNHNNRSFIYILGATMLTILLFAVINYVNLTIAQAGFRAKEAAIRRLSGSSRHGLISKFLTESIFLCFIASLIAFLLAISAEPIFNKTLLSEISVTDNLTLPNILFILACIIILGGISGIIPASIITNFKPIEITRGSFRQKTKMVFSKYLICFQYGITIILIGCVITIMRQTDFMRRYDLGFNKENIVFINFPVDKKETVLGIRNILESIKGVEKITFCRNTFLDGGNNNTVPHKDPARPMISFQVFKGDSSFFDFMELQIIRETGIKSPDAAWLNEEAVKELGLSDTTDVIPINYPTTLAGVVKNFHFRDLSQKITPAYIQILKPNERPYDILIKISGAEQNKTLEEILKAYTDYFGIKPNYYGFMDEAINEWYNNQERTYTIIGYFALLAILISSLGLFAMATYFIRQQAKTIAIRKTFGSFNHEIFRQLTVTFLKLVVISYLLAIPVIWYSMTKWLSNYPYRINLSWTIFALAGLTVLIIAFIAVFRQSYKATQANPVNSLHE